jgi:hypothetical protein
MNSFDNADPSMGAIPPIRRKRSIWQALRLGTFVVVLTAAATVTILAVTGVWDPRGPELKLPSLHAPETTTPAPPTTDNAAPTSPSAVDRPNPPHTAEQTAPPPVAATPTPAAPPRQQPAPTGATPAPPVAATEAPASAAAAAPTPAAKSTTTPRESSASSSKRRSTAAPTASEAIVSPREACTGRTQFAWYRCMQAQCEKPRLYTHPECVRFRSSGDSGD